MQSIALGPLYKPVLETTVVCFNGSLKYFKFSEKKKEKQNICRSNYLYNVYGIYKKLILWHKVITGE